MHHFCTYFDHRFLDRGLALYESLKQNSTTFKLWTLCMDRHCFNVLKQMHLSSMQLISLDQLEAADPALKNTKTNRTTIEYYFTCSPALPLYLLELNAELKEITYLDADLYFYHDPAVIYEEIGDRSIAIIPHHYPRRLRYREKYGIYNVGFIYFRRDENGLACLRWWRRRCIEWCHTRAEGGRFADQKYLDAWPALFDQVAVLEHKGLNLAAWNMANYRIFRDRSGIRVNGQPLVFFHFQGLRRIRPWLYDPHTLDFGLVLSTRIKKMIFVPYIRTLIRINRMAFCHGRPKRTPENLKNFVTGFPPGKRLKRLLSAGLHTTISILTRNYIVVRSDKP